jgi:hypothetical protein
LRALAPEDMCTSLAPGFYLRDIENFRNWKSEILKLKHRFKGDCIFSIYEQRPAFMKEYTFREEV